MKPSYCILVHGGAGTLRRESMTPEIEHTSQQGLLASIAAAENILKNGGNALDAVEAAVRVLEDDPMFNAGRGSVFTHEGKHEMDASIMDGSSRAAGAVAGISGVKNPVSLARLVMDKTPHLMLCGSGAMKFAEQSGVPMADDVYFHTEHRYLQLLEAQRHNVVDLDHAERKFGTVGAVALDMHGHLAAATSTGGMTNKQYGRVGDTPIIGSGTYADDQCAISCTGHGEFFMRNVVAHDISCLHRYKNLSLQEACNEVVKEKLVRQGGEGGVIALDNQGNMVFCFNTPGMYRAGMCEGGEAFAAIYNDVI